MLAATLLGVSECGMEGREGRGVVYNLKELGHHLNSELHKIAMMHGENIWAGPWRPGRWPFNL